MSWLGQLRSTWRELRHLQAILATPRDKRPILVYSEDVSSYNVFAGYLNELMDRHHLPIVYVTSAPEDPLLSEHHRKMSVVFIRRLVPSFIPRVDSELFITTMPDLGKLHVPRPPRQTRCLYLFHSLNSIHEVYRRGAFDHYDVFFCCGPHHKRELTRHFEHYRLPMPELHEVGYYKLDRIFKAHASYQKQHPDRKTILLAPSWGERNLLESHGIDILEHLLPLGAHIVVRPHPCFFLPIYPKGREIVDAIARRFEDHPNVEIERTIHTEDSFHEADIMLSDFSGAAYEYALGTLRPVLFIDVARKTMNPDWRELGLPTFEDTMRSELGRILPPSDLGALPRHVAEMMDHPAPYKERAEKLRRSAIYNFGRSAEVGARIIRGMIDRHEARPTVEKTV